MMAAMTWTAPSIDRIQNPAAVDERAMLEGWLAFHRQTLLWKCEGLTAEQLKLASVAPSSLTLLGLVRHMAEVERGWFRLMAAGEQVEPIYCTDEYPDGDFDLLADADAEADFATFHAEIALADKAAEGRSLEQTFTTRRGRTLNLRWVYQHMIEEYARHNGHADLIRERIDGATGD